LGKLLVVDRTGGGKSHILRLVATMVNGIILVIVPLLALSADQMANIIGAIRDFVSSEGHHLGELSRSQINNDVIPRMDDIQYSTSSTMFLFTSPQQLVVNPTILDALLRCHARQTLRMVAIDEAHLYAMHGRSFRMDIRVLQKILFEIIFKEGAWHPLFLDMTTTMTISLVESFSTLTMSTGMQQLTTIRDGIRSATFYGPTRLLSDSDT